MSSTHHLCKWCLSVFAVCRVFFFTFQKKSIKWLKCITFFSTFTFNIKIIKIHNAYTDHIERCIEISPFRICIDIINLRHMWKKITYSNVSYWKMLQIFSQPIQYYNIMQLSFYDNSFYSCTSNFRPSASQRTLLFKT